jgi:hypothetical protein
MRCSGRRCAPLLEAEGIGYTIRMPADAVLQERIG